MYWIFLLVIIQVSLLFKEKKKRKNAEAINEAKIKVNVIRETRNVDYAK